MTEHIVKCGCGRTMALDGRRGRGAYRCGCGARVVVTEAETRSRRCWYRGCRLSPTTPEPLSLCEEHEKDVAIRVAHLIGRHNWGSLLDASRAAGESWYRPLDRYRQPPTPAESWVYFMRRERYIKIGTTTDIRRRAQQLNATVLAKRPGSYREEASLHARFVSLRRHGEWFEPGPELLALINEIRDTDNLPPLTE